MELNVKSIKKNNAFSSSLIYISFKNRNLHFTYVYILYIDSESDADVLVKRSEKAEVSNLGKGWGNFCATDHSFSHQHN